MKPILKKGISLCLALMAGALPLFSANAVYASEPPEAEKAIGAYLYNFENDTTLYSLREDARLYPASTVKIMTGILAIEALGDTPEATITVTKDMLYKVVGNNIGLEEGEIVTVDDMLHALLVNGANDAAQVLAIHIAGSVDAFVTMMNDKAQRLGAYNTYYTNPTGMHNDAMITSVSDTADIAKYAYSLPRFVEITSVPKYVMDATNKNDYRNLFNRNSQLSKYYDTRYYYPDSLGMNAGYTVQGGYNIVSVARKENLTYLAIVMNAEGTEEGVYSYMGANALLSWAFEAYGYREVLSASERICEMDVELSSTVDYVTLVPAASIVKYLPTDVDPSSIAVSYNTFDEKLTAPVEAGQVCGIVTVTAGGEILGSADLIATTSVTRSEFLFFLQRTKAFTDSRFFKATVVFMILFSTAYILYRARTREQRARRGKIY